MWFLIIQFIERNIIKNPSFDCSLHILQSNYNNRKNIMFTEAVFFSVFTVEHILLKILNPD